MNIHEYQAKELFRSYGIPVPEGRVAEHASEAAAAARELGPDVVIKAQIHAGGRGRAGGVKPASTPEEAERIAASLLGRALITGQTGPEGRMVRAVLVERGQKIALVGRNGEGKTTFARMLIGQLAPTEGSIRLGANVRVGYYAQNQDDLMEGEFTVYDTLDRVAVGDIRTRLRDILGAFLFRGEEVDKKVKVLSGGERSRLAMARLMLEPYNLLVLDEPTNHMDMRSKDILKRALQKYDGTVVVVSHDREFLDGIVDKVYEFRDGGVKEYLGGIYYFLEKRKLDSLRDVERKEAPAPAAAPKTEAPKLTYEQKKEQEKLLRKLRRAVESIETELAETERRIADYDARFAAATAYDEADYKAYDDLKAHYDHLMHEWEKASYELEITENG